MKKRSFAAWAALLLTMAMFAGCAGSKGAAAGDGGGGGGGTPKATAGALESASKEALELENDNHELRREIFDAKNKLGIADTQPEE